ncbi:MAG: alpha/beta hydrolase family protein [Candidatus Acidiferrales bacterium]
MRRSLLVCLLLLLCSEPALSQKQAAPGAVAANQSPLIRDASFHSDSLNRDGHYQILLPKEYSRGGQFPVLYLLHGLYGDDRNWETRTGLKNYARNLPLLIVMPDADDSWYTNSATVPQDKFEDFIARDLIAEIDGKYRTIRARRGRAIAGLSMGGYGAVKMALKYPKLFAFAGSLSGALNAAQNLDSLRPDFRAKLLAVFGNEGSPTREENDVFLLLKKTPDQTPLPYLYLACGASDSFLDTNRAFVLQLSSRKIEYEYHETPGGHTWEYWDGALPPILQAIQRKVTSFAPNP